MWRSRKGKVKITVEIDADIAGAILTLAEMSKISGEQKAAQLLKEAIWNTNGFEEPGLNAPVAQWANRLLAQTLDKGARAIRISKMGSGIWVECLFYDRCEELDWQALGGGDLGFFPDFDYAALFERYEKITGSQLRSQATKDAGTRAVIHRDQHYNMTVSYEANIQAETRESLVIRMWQDAPLPPPP